MSIQAEIEHCLEAAFAPVHLGVENESHMHNVPDGAESHFRVVLVSEAFEGERRVRRHQQVYHVLGDIMGQIHALALHTMTPQEWQHREAPASPACLGGSKQDSGAA
jgi:BolA protein